MTFAFQRFALSALSAVLFVAGISAFAAEMAQVEQDRQDVAPTQGTATTKQELQPTHEVKEEAMGPEYRREHPNVLGPMKTGLTVNTFKAYQIEIDKAKQLSKEEARVQLNLLKDRLENWVTEAAKAMALPQNDKVIALDQLALMTGALKYETFKLVVIKGFAGRLKKDLGNREEILNQFEDSTKRNEARRLLR